MPDDPNKRGPQDRSRVSKQKHEQAYQRRKASVRSARGTAARSRVASGGNGTGTRGR